MNEAPVSPLLSKGFIYLSEVVCSFAIDVACTASQVLGLRARAAVDAHGQERARRRAADVVSALTHTYIHTLCLLRELFWFCMPSVVSAASV